MKPAVFSLSQNTTFLTVAAIFQKVISALYFFLVSWVIGTEQTAAYFNIFAAIAVFTVVADFGMNNVLTREAARNPEQSAKIFYQTLTLKLFFGFLALVSLGASKFFLNYPDGGWKLIVIAGTTLWFDSIRSLMYSYLRAHKNVRYEAVGLVAAQFSVALIGVVFLVLKLPLVALVGIFMIVSIAQTIYAVWSVVTYTNSRIMLAYEHSLALKIVREALPFALAGIIAQVYAYQDAFIIHHYLSATEGGNWARAYKLVYAFQFIPVALGASAYPVISVAAAHNHNDRIITVIKRAYEYLLLIAFPVMAGIGIVAEPLFSRYAHKFVPSLPALIILIWSLGFGFLWLIHGAVLNGSRRQNIQTGFVALAGALSIGINIIAIPRYGISGAASAAVISNIVLWVLGYYMVNRMFPLPHRVLFFQALRIGGATACMVLALLGVRLLDAPALLLVPVGIVSYGIGLIACQAVSKELRVSFFEKIPVRFLPRNLRL